jgi:hypothetical protein
MARAHFFLDLVAGDGEVNYGGFLIFGFTIRVRPG